MVLPALLALGALGAVLAALHIEQRATPEPAFDWAARLAEAGTVEELLQVPLPRAVRGVDPAAVQAVIARAGELAMRGPLGQTDVPGRRTDADPAQDEWVPAPDDEGPPAPVEGRDDA